MTGRVRYLLAAAFVVLYFLIPSPDGPEDRRYLSFLQVRKWLMDAGDSPFFRLMQDGRVPPLQVTLKTSPPIEDLAEQRQREAEYARSAREWAEAREGEGLETEDGRLVGYDPALPPVPLEVVVGEHGARATLAVPGGPPLIQEAFYPVRSSLLPAFLAIALAILTGRVIPALLLGCIAGGILHTGGLLTGIGHFFGDTLWTDVLGSGFNMRVTAFVVFLFMAVGVMSRSGGIQGMVQWISRFARGPISSQVCAYVIGILIFFDDYSNCIISGTTMRPLTDRNRVSREKLAYIVDSTAAPIAGISIFSTWIAYEVSQFRGQLPLVTDETGTPYTANDGFAVFVQTLPFRFYCIFTLMMVFLTILLRREWGPMLTAERRARREGKPVADDATPMVSKDLASLEAPPGAPLRGINAFVPVLLLVVITIYLIYRYGAYEDGVYRVPEHIENPFERLQWIMGHSASETALMWASLAALVVAALLALGQRILKPVDVVVSAVRSARSLFFAIVILLLAWSIGTTCGDLGTNFYLTAAFREAMNAMLLPIVMFVLAGLVAFSTGTSYGTMAILLPNVVVLSHTIGSASEIGGPGLMVLTIGAVLEGSIFGDHCSPISDTTVLSSVGTGSDHLHHVQTQAPYALLAMGVAILCGYLPMVLLGPGLWPLAWLTGLGAMALFLWQVGRRPE